MLMGLVTSVFLTALCLVVLVGDIKGFLLDRKLRARGYTRLRYVFQRLERDEDGTLRWREENPRQWRCATTGDPEHGDSLFLGTPVYVCEQTGEEVVLRDTLQPSWATWGGMICTAAGRSTRSSTTSRPTGRCSSAARRSRRRSIRAWTHCSRCFYRFSSSGSSKPVRPCWVTFWGDGRSLGGGGADRPHAPAGVTLRVRARLRGPA